MSADRTRETVPARDRARTVADSVSPTADEGRDDRHRLGRHRELGGGAEQLPHQSREADAVVGPAFHAHRVDVHRERHRPQHLAVEIPEEGPHAPDVARRAGDQHGRARRRGRHRGARPGERLRLRLDLRPGVVVGLGGDRLAGQHAAALVAARRRVVGRAGRRVALRAGERVDAEHRRLAAHDLDGAAVAAVAPGVALRLRPGVEQRIERPGPDAAVGRQAVDADAGGGGVPIGGGLSGEAHRNPGRRLDPPRQNGRLADARKRQGHPVRRQQPRGQGRLLDALPPRQPEPGALDRPDDGEARPLRRRPQRRDLACRLIRLAARLLPDRRAAPGQEGRANKRGHGQAPTPRLQRPETHPRGLGAIGKPF